MAKLQFFDLSTHIRYIFSSIPNSVTQIRKCTPCVNGNLRKPSLMLHEVLSVREHVAGWDVLCIWDKERIRLLNIYEQCFSCTCAFVSERGAHGRKTQRYMASSQDETCVAQERCNSNKTTQRIDTEKESWKASTRTVADLLVVNTYVRRSR